MGWLRSLWLRQRRQRIGERRPAARTRLRLESLEERCLLAVDITEFALPTRGGSALGITAGPDGNFWFTEITGGGSLDKVGRITPTGAITEFNVPKSPGSTTLTTARSWPIGSVSVSCRWSSSWPS